MSRLGLLTARAWLRGRARTACGSRRGRRRAVYVRESELAPGGPAIAAVFTPETLRGIRVFPDDGIDPFRVLRIDGDRLDVSATRVQGKPAAGGD